MEVALLIIVGLLLIIAVLTFAFETSSGPTSTIDRIGQDARSRIDTASSDYLKNVRDNTRR